MLFLDELPEFDRKVLEVLRQPIEAKEIVISRASRQITFPANFQLIAAMNPCPCGYAFNQDSRCQCSAEAIKIPSAIGKSSRELSLGRSAGARLIVRRLVGN